MNLGIFRHSIGCLKLHARKKRRFCIPVWLLNDWLTPAKLLPICAATTSSSPTLLHGLHGESVTNGTSSSSRNDPKDRRCSIVSESMSEDSATASSVTVVPPTALLDEFLALSLQVIGCSDTAVALSAPASVQRLINTLEIPQTEHGNIAAPARGHPAEVSCDSTFGAAALNFASESWTPPSSVSLRPAAGPAAADSTFNKPSGRIFSSSSSACISALIWSSFPFRPIHPPVDLPPVSVIPATKSSSTVTSLLAQQIPLLQKIMRIENIRTISEAYGGEKLTKLTNAVADAVTAILNSPEGSAIHFVDVDRVLVCGTCSPPTIFACVNFLTASTVILQRYNPSPLVSAKLLRALCTRLCTAPPHLCSVNALKCPDCGKHYRSGLVFAGTAALKMLSSAFSQIATVFVSCLGRFLYIFGTSTTVAAISPPLLQHGAQLLSLMNSVVASCSVSLLPYLAAMFHHLGIEGSIAALRLRDRLSALYSQVAADELGVSVALSLRVLGGHVSPSLVRKTIASFSDATPMIDDCHINFWNQKHESVSWARFQNTLPSLVVIILTRECCQAHHCAAWHFLHDLQQISLPLVEQFCAASESTATQMDRVCIRDESPLCSAHLALELSRLQLIHFVEPQYRNDSDQPRHLLVAMLTNRSSDHSSLLPLHPVVGTLGALVTKSTAMLLSTCIENYLTENMCYYDDYSRLFILFLYALLRRCLTEGKEAVTSSTIATAANRILQCMCIQLASGDAPIVNAAPSLFWSPSVVTAWLPTVTPLKSLSLSQITGDLVDTIVVGASIGIKFNLGTVERVCTTLLALSASDISVIGEDMLTRFIVYLCAAHRHVNSVEQLLIWLMEAMCAVSPGKSVTFFPSFMGVLSGKDNNAEGHSLAADFYPFFECFADGRQRLPQVTSLVHDHTKFPPSFSSVFFLLQALCSVGFPKSPSEAISSKTDEVLARLRSALQSVPGICADQSDISCMVADICSLLSLLNTVSTALLSCAIGPASVQFWDVFSTLGDMFGVVLADVVSIAEKRASKFALGVLLSISLASCAFYSNAAALSAQYSIPALSPCGVSDVSYEQGPLTAHLESLARLLDLVTVQTPFELLDVGPDCVSATPSEDVAPVPLRYVAADSLISAAACCLCAFSPLCSDTLTEEVLVHYFELQSFRRVASMWTATVASREPDMPCSVGAIGAISCLTVIPGSVLGFARQRELSRIVHREFHSSFAEPHALSYDLQRLMYASLWTGPYQHMLLPVQQLFVLLKRSLHVRCDAPRHKPLPLRVKHTIPKNLDANGSHILPLISSTVIGKLCSVALAADVLQVSNVTDPNLMVTLAMMSSMVITRPLPHAGALLAVVRATASISRSGLSGVGVLMKSLHVRLADGFDLPVAGLAPLMTLLVLCMRSRRQQRYSIVVAKHLLRLLVCAKRLNFFVLRSDRLPARCHVLIRCWSVCSLSLSRDIVKESAKVTLHDIPEDIFPRILIGIEIANILCPIMEHLLTSTKCHQIDRGDIELLHFYVIALRNMEVVRKAAFHHPDVHDDYRRFFCQGGVYSRILEASLHAIQLSIRDRIVSLTALPILTNTTENSEELPAQFDPSLSKPVFPENNKEVDDFLQSHVPYVDFAGCHADGSVLAEGSDDTNSSIEDPTADSEEEAFLTSVKDADASFLDISLDKGSSSSSFSVFLNCSSLSHERFVCVALAPLVSMKCYGIKSALFDRVLADVQRLLSMVDPVLGDARIHIALLQILHLAVMFGSQIPATYLYLKACVVGYMEKHCIDNVVSGPFTYYDKTLAAAIVLLDCMHLSIELSSACVCFFEQHRFRVSLHHFDFYKKHSTAEERFQAEFNERSWIVCRSTGYWEFDFILGLRNAAAVVEVNGPSHYIDFDSQVLNPRSWVKLELVRHRGFAAISLPTLDSVSPALACQLVEQSIVASSSSRGVFSSPSQLSGATFCHISASTADALAHQPVSLVRDVLFACDPLVALYRCVERSSSSDQSAVARAKRQADTQKKKIERLARVNSAMSL